jgi:hypothetical protein
MSRRLLAPLLALGLLLVGGCSDSQSGGESNPDNQIDQAPGQPGDEPSAAPTR